ncbi:MAG: anaerobic ribonucleoside-triphosphate reductase activating protein [Lachnospiraceae bacterium]|nr:anaerobic ribonucleoside-triphosphate reductase activating protein [Lachnospiraceae bacterium]
MRFHNITHDDMKNGTGMRVVLWVAGCEHRCVECHNPLTWDPYGGLEFTLWEEAEFYDWLAKPWTEGATFSGGDPLHPMNRNYIGNMVKNIKANFPGKNIWVYTGYQLIKGEDTFHFENSQGESFFLDWLPYIDVLVDGRFEADTRRHDIENGRKVYWRGSSNQRVIDIPETIKNNKITISKE